MPVTQLLEVLPTVDPELGALLCAELQRHDVTVSCNTHVEAIAARPEGSSPPLVVQVRSADGRPLHFPADLVLVVVGVRPDSEPTTQGLLPRQPPDRGALHRRRRTGQLLGVQLVGHRTAEIAKRIDIPAVAIFNELLVEQLSDLDLSYTPPLVSPWDAIQIGAQSLTRLAAAGAVLPLRGQ